MTDDSNAEQMGEQALQDIYNRIDALSAEDRALFIDDMLSIVHDDLGKDEAFSSPTNASVSRQILSYKVALLGYANRKGAEQHEDWTKTGDRGVDLLLHDIHEAFRHAIQNAVQIDAESLPKDVRKRLESGTATDADREAVKALVLEQHPEFADRLADAEFVSTDSGQKAPAEDDGLSGLYM